MQWIANELEDGRSLIGARLRAPSIDGQDSGMVSPTVFQRSRTLPRRARQRRELLHQLDREPAERSGHLKHRRNPPDLRKQLIEPSLGCRESPPTPVGA